MAVFNDVQNIIEELRTYVDIEGSELGEICHMLIELSRYVDYVSPEFYQALFEELKKQLDFFEKNCKIIESEQREVYTVRELEWNSNIIE